MPAVSVAHRGRSTVCVARSPFIGMPLIGGARQAQLGQRTIHSQFEEGEKRQPGNRWEPKAGVFAKLYELPSM